MIAEKSGNIKATLLAETLDVAIGKYLENGRMPSRKVKEIDNRGSSFGLSLNIPILNGFTASNNVRRAKINHDQQKYQLDQEELNLEKIIHQVYADAIGALKLYDATKRSLEALSGKAPNLLIPTPTKATPLDHLLLCIVLSSISNYLLCFLIYVSIDKICWAVLICSSSDCHLHLISFNLK